MGAINHVLWCHYIYILYCIIFEYIIFNVNYIDQYGYEDDDRRSPDGRPGSSSRENFNSEKKMSLEPNNNDRNNDPTNDNDRNNGKFNNNDRNNGNDSMKRPECIEALAMLPRL